MPADAAASDAPQTATLDTVLSALALGPAAGLGAAERAASLRHFAKRYTHADEHLRAYADAALDELEAGVPGGFSGLDAAAALAQLTAWHGDTTRAPLVASALTLAGLHPDGDDEARQAGFALTLAGGA
jgi:hypothetical protein